MMFTFSSSVMLATRACAFWYDCAHIGSAAEPFAVTRLDRLTSHGKSWTYGLDKQDSIGRTTRSVRAVLAALRSFLVMTPAPAGFAHAAFRDFCVSLSNQPRAQSQEQQLQLEYR